MAVGEAPIIIKKVKKGGHDGHHGGAWKVAYADFVTAMMAFFLLMWLINTTTPEQKRGIADYFAPQSIAQTVSGSGGVLGGKVMGEDSAHAGGAQSVMQKQSPPAPDSPTKAMANGGTQGGADIAFGETAERYAEDAGHQRQPERRAAAATDDIGGRDMRPCPGQGRNAILDRESNTLQDRLGEIGPPRFVRQSVE